MAGFNNAPTIIKAVFVLSILGVVVDLVGFATVSWRSFGYYTEGLWRACGYRTCYDIHAAPGMYMYSN